MRVSNTHDFVWAQKKPTFERLLMNVVVACRFDCNNSVFVSFFLSLRRRKKKLFLSFCFAAFAIVMKTAERQRSFIKSRENREEEEGKSHKRNLKCANDISSHSGVRLIRK